MTTSFTVRLDMLCMLGLGKRTPSENTAVYLGWAGTLQPLRISMTPTPSVVSRPIDQPSTIQEKKAAKQQKESKLQSPRVRPT
jgi:hypothetical protein